MKKLIYFTLLLLGTLNAFGQNDESEGMKQVEAAHVAWLTKQLSLTPEEAQRFWPIYNNYQKELRQIQQARRQARAQKGPDDSELDFDGRVLDLRKRYLREFRKTLPPGRAARLFQADREFNDQLLQQFRKRRGGGG